MQQPNVSFVWGNHDVAWLGACLGHEPLICHVLRISLRYRNLSQLEEGYGIPVQPLEALVRNREAEGARLAEQEWQRAVPTQRGKTFSGTPGINVKPVVGGVEISVRYITRANERFQLRAKLYQDAVDLLGQKPAPA